MNQMEIFKNPEFGSVRIVVDGEKYFFCGMDVARALGYKDTVNATQYAEYALKADKEYAPAFMLFGDIAALCNDGGLAASNYQQAIFFDPKNPEPYIKYASVYRKTGDKEWLKKILPTLEKEYQFWMTRRITPIGLNRYGNEATEQDKAGFIDLLRDRLGKNFTPDTLPVEEQLKIGSHFIAEAESGWDFNPRFHSRCMDFCPLDLNANLYLYEKNFAYFASERGDKPAAKQWTKKAEARKKLIRKYCRDPKTGMYYDYDYVNGRRSDVISSAIFSLLYAEAVSPKDAASIVDQGLKALEFAHGIAACENKPYDFVYQWSYPNGWAPLHFLAIKGLDNYGYKEEASRIASKYVDMVVRNFESTHNLWEKYNVVEGNINVSNEYDMPTMIGWTAGTYVTALNYLKQSER